MSIAFYFRQALSFNMFFFMMFFNILDLKGCIDYEGSFTGRFVTEEEALTRGFSFVGT